MNQNNKNGEQEHIFTVNDKKEEQFLRRKTVHFDFKKFDYIQTVELIRRMKKAMRAAKGVGLSANQIGLSYRLFIAEVPASNGDIKFYALFNPTIEKTTGKLSILEEGCLSVPNTYGQTKRCEKVYLKAQDKKGRTVRIKAWGLLAQVFQHEIGHLDGELFTDHALEQYSMPNSPRLTERDETFNISKSTSQK